MSSISETTPANAARRPVGYKLVRVAVLAAVLLAAVLAVGRFTGRPSVACATLAQAAEYIQGVKSMHITARMRTSPTDNLDMLDLKADLIPVEMWKQFDNPPQVRVEKEGRQVVTDGKTTILMITSGKTVLAKKFNGLAEGCYETLAPLLHPESLFRREKELAESNGSTVDVATKTGDDGREKTILTISARAQGNYTQSETAKNRSIIESDNIRVYTFDAETYRCEGLQVYVHTDQGSILALETTQIDYDTPIAASVFHLDVPETAVWDKEPSELGAPDNSFMSADEFADQFFQALSRSDSTAIRQMGASWLDSPQYRKVFAGLTIVNIGEPYKSGLYPGYFVPYEIRFKSGQIKRFNLAVRNDNPKHQWRWDGGL